jgi:D-galactarolactone isomerase
MAEGEFRLPPGSTDTHMHIYEPGHRPNPLASPPEPEATLADYSREMARIGIERAVIVQPSAFGTDNACTLAAIAALGPNGRGVAILDEAVTDRELDLLGAQGIVGLRGLLTSPAGMMTWERVRTMAPRVVARGWNLNLQFDAREFPEREDFLRALPGQLVFDHLGVLNAPLDPDGPELAPLLRLLDTGRAWIKLSAPYTIPGSAAPYPEASAVARRFVAHAPERCLWASNWPHPQRAPRPDTLALAALLEDWAPDPAVRHRILVENPARLYGFGS